jgi:hypothetical protein
MDDILGADYTRLNQTATAVISPATGKHFRENGYSAGHGGPDIPADSGKSPSFVTSYDHAYCRNV